MFKLIKTSIPLVLASLLVFSPAQADTAVDAEWSALAWYQIPGKYKKHWRKLGWTEKVWDAGDAKKFPESNSKAWHELSEEERTAAYNLGYDEACWNAERK